MGNQITMHTICNNIDENKSNRGNILSKCAKWINSRRHKQSTNNDKFIISHNQMNKGNNSKIDIKSLDDRRVVFVSLIGLYQTFADCPSFILHSAIFLLPLKRKWIYNPAKYINEIQSNEVISEFNAFADISELTRFIQLLQWKDKQGGVFWMLRDDYSEYSAVASRNKTSIHPFWYDVSQQLTRLYDPISGDNYKPLNLDAKSWRNAPVSNHKYCIETGSILNELHALTMRFKCIQEILYESNPNSLLPVKAYGVCNACILAEHWWVSDDYDPYEL